MFYMKELPNEEDFRPLVPEYSSLDTSSVMLFYLFLQVGSDMLTAFETYLADHGISQGRFTVLLLLLRSQVRRNGAGGLSPSELARQAGVTRATMTGLMKGLQRGGLIERSGHDGDGRKVIVRLTPRGKESLHIIFPAYYSRIAELMNELEDEEREKLSMLLHKMKNKMSASITGAGCKRSGMRKTSVE